MLAKKTAEYIRNNYPKGKGHCEDSLLNPSVMIAELDTVLGMRKTHNIPTNYSQTLNRTKVDGVQETNGESIGTKKDELER